MARDLVIVACAVSAGIHAALAPGHLAEGVGAGVGFLVAAVVLATLAVVVTRRLSVAALLGAAAVLVGLIASYALAVTTGMPLLHPEPEPVEALALVTKAIEAVGLVAAVHLLLAPTPRPRGALA
jgi:hypothetical protein